MGPQGGPGDPKEQMWGLSEVPGGIREGPGCIMEGPGPSFLLFITVLVDI